MPRWTCPRCEREFGRANQSHTCVPGCTVDATFVLHDAGEVDDHVRGWLAEAFLHASD